MKKLSLITLLLITMLLSFTACNQDDNTQDTDDTSTPPVHTHSYGEWDIIKKPTCIENGEKARYCSCGEKQTEVVVTLDHTEVKDEAVAPTCTATGLTEGKHCSVCGTTLVAQTTVNAHGHSHSAVVTEPTCTEQGYTTHTCHCGNTYVDTYTNALGHTEVKDEAVAPTCTATGLTEGKHCSVCNTTLVAQTTVNALGHSHNAVVTDPTCTEQGYTTHTCHCGNSYVDTYTNALGHSFGDWTVVKAPTTKEEGLKARACECGEKETLSLPKLTPSLEFTLKDDKASYSVTGIGTYDSTELIIPSTYNGLPVTSIGNNAFLRCRNITAVIIPDSVTSIGAGAFAACSGLENILIPNSVTSIGMEAFVQCTSLRSIDIPLSVTVILIDVFVGCDKLTIYCEATSKPSGWSSNWNSSNIPVVWGENDVTEFKYASNGTSITITKYIGSTPRVKIPAEIDGMPVATISSNAFASCTHVTEIIIPDSVTYIGYGAFQSCTSLKSIHIGKGVSTIENVVFWECTNLANITVSADNKYFSSFDGNLYNKKQTELVQYAAGKDANSFTVPSGVTSINSYAFSYCANLTEILLPDTLLYIRSHAFCYCTGLTTVVIPNKVTNIGTNMKSGMESLSTANKAKLLKK